MKPLIFCYYCDREFEDEKILMQHQAAKHFKCSECKRRLGSAHGMQIHVFQVHKKEISKVPFAKEGRDSFDIDILGMSGVPQELINEKLLAKEELPFKRIRVEKQDDNENDDEETENDNKLHNNNNDNKNDNNNNNDNNTNNTNNINPNNNGSHLNNANINSINQNTINNVRNQPISGTNPSHPFQPMYPMHSMHYPMNPMLQPNPMMFSVPHIPMNMQQNPLFPPHGTNTTMQTSTSTPMPSSVPLPSVLNASSMKPLPNMNTNNNPMMMPTVLPYASPIPNSNLHDGNMINKQQAMFPVHHMPMMSPMQQNNAYPFMNTIAMQPQMINQSKNIQSVNLNIKTNIVNNFNDNNANEQHVDSPSHNENDSKDKKKNVLVYDDEATSMEEKRFMHSKYHYISPFVSNNNNNNNNVDDNKTHNTT